MNFAKTDDIIQNETAWQMYEIVCNIRRQRGRREKIRHIHALDPRDMRIHFLPGCGGGGHREQIYGGIFLFHL